MARILLIAFIAIFISSDALVAQQSSRRGRFFQNLFGGGQKAPAPSEALQQQQQQAQQLQQQYQQRLQQQKQQLQSRTPTPLRSTNQPSAATRTPTPLTPKTPSRSTYHNPRSSTLKSPPATVYNSKKPTSYRPRSTSSASRNGFGFRITGNDKDQLIVSSVDRAGNAAEAGLVRGDQLIEIGGIDASSTEEFDEIVKIMGQGDQMDFKIRRAGRERKMTIQFGVIPEPPEGTESSTAQSALSSSSSSSRSSSSNSRRYDFAPPKDSSRANSVKQVSATSARQIQQLNQTIVNQHKQIQDMQKEIEQLRRGFRSRQ